MTARCRRYRCRGAGAAGASGAQDKFPSRNDPHHRAVPGRRHHRHAGAAVRPAHERRPWARASWSRMSAAAAARSAPTRSPRRRPTATRCCSATSPSPPRRRRCMYAKRARHDFDDFVPVSVGAYVPLLLLAHPSVPAKDLKEFVDLRQGDADAAVLRLDRPGQHPASDGRGAQTRRRHQDGSRAVPRRRAAGHRAPLRAHPVRRRPVVELARARAHRPAQGAGGRHQVGGAAERADGDASSASPISSCKAGTASWRRRARRSRSSPGSTRRSRPPPSIPTWSSA